MLFTDGVTYEFGSDVTGLEDSRYGAGMMTYIVDNADRVDSRQDQLAFGLTTLQTSDATLVYITSDNSNDYIRIELVSLRCFLLAYSLNQFFRPTSIFRFLMFSSNELLVVGLASI